MSAALAAFQRSALFCLLSAAWTVSPAAGIRSRTHGQPLKRGQPLKQQWPWYKSGDELLTALQDLTSNCKGAEASLAPRSMVNSGSGEHQGETVELQVLNVRRSNAKANTKALLVFGEHARELITGEAALGLAKALCGQGPSAQQASAVLDNVEFILVPNANPIGRKRVEGGEYCKRTNEDGVDLNRNWAPDKRDTSLQPGDEQYPGAGEFEPETQLLQALIDEQKPDIYLSVHSGAYLLGMPYGYDSSRTPTDETAMMSVLQPISDNHCGGQCPFGNLADLIHYDNPGCDIDYVYDRLKTPYVFTWEIFVGEDFRGGYEEEAKFRKDKAAKRDQSPSFLQARGKQRTALRTRVGTEVQGPEANEEIWACMDQFNPQSEEETTQVVKNWAAAFVELASEVSAKRKASSPTADAA